MKLKRCQLQTFGGLLFTVIFTAFVASNSLSYTHRVSFQQPSYSSVTIQTEPISHIALRDNSDAAANINQLVKPVSVVWQALNDLYPAPKTHLSQATTEVVITLWKRNHFYVFISALAP